MFWNNLVFEKGDSVTGSININESVSSAKARGFASSYDNSFPLYMSLGNNFYNVLLHATIYLWNLWYFIIIDDLVWIIWIFNYIPPPNV